MANRAPARDSGVGLSPLHPRGGRDLTDNNRMANPPAAAAAAVTAIRGGDLATIPLFSGKLPPEEDIESWIRHVERAQASYGWSSQLTAAAAKQRLTGRATGYVTNEEADGRRFREWSNVTNVGHVDEGLKQALLGRFRGRVNAAQAAIMCANIKLEQGESIRDLYDRIRTAAKYQVKGANPNLAEGTAAFRQARDAQSFSTLVLAIKDTPFFSASIGRDSSTLTDVNALVTKLEELELGKGVNKPDLKVAALHTEDDSDGKPPQAEEETTDTGELAMLKEKIERLERYNRASRGRGAPQRFQHPHRRAGPGCFNCGAPGHFARECPQSPTSWQRGRGSQARGWSSPRFQPRGRGRGYSPQGNLAELRADQHSNSRFYMDHQTGEIREVQKLKSYPNEEGGWW